MIRRLLLITRGKATIARFIPRLPSRFWMPRENDDLKSEHLVLMGHGVARSPADAERLLRQHRGVPLDKIIRKAKGKRKSLWRGWWNRLKKYW